MIILYFFLTILSSVLTGLFYKFGSMRQGKNPSSPALLCTIYMSFSSLYFLVAIIISNNGFSSSLSTVLCALGGGACLAIAAYLYLVSLTCGPYTISVVLLNLSSFAVIFYAILFLNETMTALQGFALVLMIACVCVLTISRSKTGVSKKANIRWIIFITLTFITNSFINLFVRMQVIYNQNTQKNEMMFLYFMFAAITSFLIFVFTGGFGKLKFKMSPEEDITASINADSYIETKRAPIYFMSILPASILLSISLGVNLIASSQLVAYSSSAIQYPVCSGSSMILSALIGRFFFKEKLNLISYIAIGVGIGVIVMLSL
ncbi:MAG: hypothetical protein VB118_00605 [Oscillospiraceae bacterium]|nr:hypothetical protein [Oscillospiraceae bacterium]